MVRKKTTIGSMAILCVLHVSAALCDEKEETTARGGFYEERTDGWHWYDDPPIPEPEEELIEPDAILPVGAPPTTKGPAPMSAEWLRQVMPELLDAAIDNPTNDNVAAYYYAQRIMFDKAQKFSDKAQQIVNSDPLLDEDLRLPFAAAAKVATLSAASDKKNEIVSKLADQIGIWVFYDETCIYCDKQIIPINRLAQKHGITIQIIHKQGGRIEAVGHGVDVKPDTGQFDSLSVEFTPTVMMVVPPDGYYKIAQGFASYSELQDKLVAAASEYGLIQKDEFYVAAPMSRGILDAASVSDDSNVDWKKTEDWVPFIRRELARTYGVGSIKNDGEADE